MPRATWCRCTQAFAVLRFLIGNAGRLVAKEEVMQVVWPGIAVTDDSLVQCVSEIRQALRDGAHATLQTIRAVATGWCCPTSSPRRLHADFILGRRGRRVAVAGFGAGAFIRRVVVEPRTSALPR